MSEGVNQGRRRGLARIGMGLVAVMFPVLAGLARANPPDPVVLVRETVDGVVAVLRQQPDGLADQSDEVMRLVEQQVAPHFDFTTMSRLVLGVTWRRASEAERTQFTAAFRQLLVRTYSKSLSQFKDEQVVVQPLSRPPREDEVTVNTEVQQSAGLPIPIDYRMQLRGSVWKVVDVVIDGVSLVTNYRTTFAQKLQTQSLRELIAQIERGQGA